MISSTFVTQMDENHIIEEEKATQPVPSRWNRWMENVCGFAIGLFFVDLTFSILRIACEFLSSYLHLSIYQEELMSLSVITGFTLVVFWKSNLYFRVMLLCYGLIVFGVQLSTGWADFQFIPELLRHVL